MNVLNGRLSFVQWASRALLFGCLLVSLGAGDIVTLRNHSSAAAVTLQTLAGGTQTNVNAALSLQKLN